MRKLSIRNAIAGKMVSLFTHFHVQIHIITKRNNVIIAFKQFFANSSHTMPETVTLNLRQYLHTYFKHANKKAMYVIAHRLFGFF